MARADGKDSRWRVPAWVLAGFLLAAASGAAATCDPEGPAWRSLRFHSRGAVARGRVTIALHGPDAAGAAQLRPCPETPETGTGPPCILLLEARAELPFHGESRLRSWIDGATGTLLQHERSREGRWLLRRFTSAGMHAWSARPASRAERRRGPEAWSMRRDQHVTWPGPALPQADTLSLLWLAGAVDLPPDGGPIHVATWSRGRLHVLSLRGGGVVELPVDHQRIVADGSRRRIRQSLSARRVLIAAEEGDGGEGPSLLGLRDDLELFVDAGSGLPLEIRGRAPVVGRLRLVLVEVAWP